MKFLVVKLSLMSVLSQLNQFPLSNAISVRPLSNIFLFYAHVLKADSSGFDIKLLFAVFLFPYDLINTYNLLLLR